MTKPTPFIEEFIEKIYKQTYPKSRLHLFVYNNATYHSEIINEFVESYGKEYKSVKRINPEDDIDEVAARHLALLVFSMLIDAGIKRGGNNSNLVFRLN